MGLGPGGKFLAGAVAGGSGLYPRAARGAGSPRGVVTGAFSGDFYFFPGALWHVFDAQRHFGGFFRAFLQRQQHRDDYRGGKCARARGRLIIADRQGRTAPQGDGILSRLRQPRVFAAARSLAAGLYGRHYFPRHVHAAADPAGRKTGGSGYGFLCAYNAAFGYCHDAGD